MSLTVGTKANAIIASHFLRLNKQHSAVDKCFIIGPIIQCQD